jgi:FtsP/CotA-like multicopper oxidase with cupredoxin domain
VVNVRNRLPETTTLHWHWMHLPARMDGGPHQPVQPGRTWSPGWRIDQPAATLWYHPHPHGSTARHLYRGLADLFLIDDPAGAPAGVPGRYGVDDIPLVVQDKRFRDGELDESLPMIPSTGILGDTISVNGVVAPYLEVGAERVRLRLLNASNARVYNFGFSDGRAFEQIGTDGGLLARPHRTTRVQLSPGERAEVVTEFRPADRVVLRSFPPDLGANAWDRRFAGGDDILDILQIRAAAALSPPQGRLPDVLDAGPRQIPTPAVTRRFELAGTQINSARMDMGRIDFAGTADSTELWEVVNSDGKPHNFHVHDVQFRVVAIDGAPPPEPLAGRKDTVYLPAGRVYRLALTFTDHTDNTVPCMFHCHLLWHEDLGMMGQFVVVEAGRRAAPPSAGGHPHHHE